MLDSFAAGTTIVKGDKKEQGEIDFVVVYFYFLGSPVSVEIRQNRRRNIGREA